MRNFKNLSLLLIICGAVCAIRATPAIAQVEIFKCVFPEFSFVITDYDDSTPSRIGIDVGVGDRAQSYFDKVTGAWIFVEFIDNGALPSTLTTILKDGTAWHSRHTIAIDGTIAASQLSGNCRRRTIN